MIKTDRIFVAGHNGMVGSAIYRSLIRNGFENIIVKSSSELDLTNQQMVIDFFRNSKIDYVFLAAAKVGGIMANNLYGGDFIYKNLMIEANVIKASQEYGLKKLLFLGSSCIYPKECLQPIKEEFLLSGYLEETNRSYAIAKIAGIELCQSFNRQFGTKNISLMPCNLYGTNDNYHPTYSHVFPALIRKIYEAKMKNLTKITIWGSGSPLREFLHVDDLADAAIFLMNNYTSDDIINVGSGEEISILELARLMSDIIGFRGEILNDHSKPDGTFRKLMDNSRMKALGWKPKISLEEGILRTFNEFKAMNEGLEGSETL